MEKSIWKNRSFLIILIIIILAILYRVFAMVLSAKFQGNIKYEIFLIVLTFLLLIVGFYYRSNNIKNNLSKAQKEENWLTLEGKLILIGSITFVLSILISSIIKHILALISVTCLLVATYSQSKKTRENEYVRDNILQYSAMLIVALVVYFVIYFLI